MTGQCATAIAGVLLLTSLLTLAACRFGYPEPGTPQGAHPIAYLKRSPAALVPPLAAEPFVPGGDLYLRDLAAPEAAEINLTRRLTRGRGDVSGPAVSYDGTRIVFALRCGPDADLACAADDTWNLWEYDLRHDLFRRLIEDDYLANLGDDLDPAYLPDGRIVFSSNRQAARPDRPWRIPEDGRRATLLHILDPATGRIEQLTHHHADDRHPVVDAQGYIVFSRWERGVHRDQAVLYRIRPDGRDERPWYGAHSPGEVFTRPEPLPDGNLLAVVGARLGDRGGALLHLDVRRYADLDDRRPDAPERGGQRPAGPFPLPVDETPSAYGRIHSVAVPWDGGPYLVAYSPAEYLPGQDPDATPPAPPRYGLYQLHPRDRTLRPLIPPQPGVALLEPVILAPRPRPPLLPEALTETLPLAAGEGLIDIRSVYDSDRLGRMGNGLLTEAERRRHPIPMIEPEPGTDIRPRVADLARLKDPARTRAEQRPAWFLRIVQRLPPDPELPQEWIGVPGYGPRRLVGYLPLEPDGSVLARVPAEVPLAVTVLDRHGRAFERHDAWFYLRPGERLVCDGCHDPKRVPPLNRPPIAGHHPNTRLRDASGRPYGEAALARPDETMAQTRVRLDPEVATPRPDLEWHDPWTDPQQAGRPIDPPWRIRYADLATPAPQDGLIDYPDHIQPLWDRARLLDLGDGVRDWRCSGCHDGRRDPRRNPSGLDLRANLAGHSGRMVSYEALTTGALVFNAQGRPYFDLIDGIAVPRRAAPLAVPGSARRSHLVERLYGEELLAERPLGQNGPDHARLMNDAERRLVVEWIDLGAQYYNRLRDADGRPRTLGPRLDYGYYFRELRGDFHRYCAACHRPLTDDGGYNRLFVPSQFILTGDPLLDFRYVAAQVDDFERPENTPLLYQPATPASGHPLVQGRPIIGPGNYDGNDMYLRLLAWIRQARGEGDAP